MVFCFCVCLVFAASGGSNHPGSHLSSFLKNVSSKMSKPPSNGFESTPIMSSGGLQEPLEAKIGTTH